MGVPSATAEAKILSEIDYLKDQMEHSKQLQKIVQVDEKNNYLSKNIEYAKSKIYVNTQIPVCDSVSHSETLLKNSTGNVYVNSRLHPITVHLNPNFKPQKSTVHINPNICKPLIHVNPRVIHDLANSNQNLKFNTSATNVNSITMNTTNMSLAMTNADNNLKQVNIKKSVYVNPTLLKKLSSSSKEKPANLKELTQRAICSRLKFIKASDNQKNSPRKANNSSIVLLSRRKLVRVTRTTKSTRIPISQYKLRKFIDLSEKKRETLLQQMKVKSFMNDMYSASTSSSLPKLSINRSVNKSKVTKYKIDRTKIDSTLSTSKVRKVLPLKNVVNNTSNFVTIGGIVYKSSKTKLIRKNCSLKRKNAVGEKIEKCNIDKKGRNNRETLNYTLNNKNKIRFISSTPVKTNYRNSMSNKVKQRSIRILQNKMHKNNQPCLIYQRFGSCPSHQTGTCPKRHDKKQVSLCKRFLQGKCFLGKCPLSHDIGPEKMPTCKYFLDGCCTRDDCPYLHVKVSANTSVCIDFLQGYCAKGNKCQQRHQYLCPEFDKSGSCSKGECCLYPHKSHSFNHEKNAKYLSKSHDMNKHQVIASTAKIDSETTNPESRLRYYEISSNLSEDPEKKKPAPALNSKQLQINENDKSLVEENVQESEMITCRYNNVKTRVSITSYIPIDSS